MRNMDLKHIVKKQKTANNVMHKIPQVAISDSRRLNIDQDSLLRQRDDRGSFTATVFLSHRIPACVVFDRA